MLAKTSNNLADRPRVISWNKELVVRQSPACKNVNMEVEDTVRIGHQATVIFWSV
jgi:hypothetical protein